MTRELKIGDAIQIRKPAEFKVLTEEEEDRSWFRAACRVWGGFDPYPNGPGGIADEMETFVIKNEEDLAKAKQLIS